ncbi:ER-type Ca2+-ATPase 2 [Artemisia annua]|uniref:ER-type Ca2+-ATPase 2 n=1 Tax=Artemisia annua TaxID=35608 RepID=A0A2U1P9N5_ARTAN|nr:ER-type Ca2+-ATPase 2 [Artemisia annua]
MKALAEKIGLPSGLDSSSSRGPSDLMGMPPRRSSRWLKLGTGLPLLNLEGDRKSMGVIMFSNFGKRLLLVKELQWALLLEARDREWQ